MFSILSININIALRLDIFLYTGLKLGFRLKYKNIFFHSTRSIPTILNLNFAQYFFHIRYHA